MTARLRRGHAGCWLVALLAFAPRVALAHPAGVSSVNRYLGVDRVADGSLRLAYELDFAELPAYLEIEKLDADHSGGVTAHERDAYLDALLPRVLAGWNIDVDARKVTPRVVARALEAPPGQGDLSTLLIHVALVVDGPFDPTHDLRVRIRDSSYADKPGVRELGASETSSCHVVKSSVPGIGKPLDYAALAGQTPRSDDATFELRVPSSDVSRAGITPAGPQLTAAAPSASSAKDAGVERLATLLRQPRAGLGFLLSALLLAFALGAVHALSPGHGKLLVSAYLVGTRGTLRHAVWLGVVLTLTHTALVFVLGAIALSLTHGSASEHMLHMLELGSGALIVAMALAQLPGRVQAYALTRSPRFTRLAEQVRAPRLRPQHAHAHDHDHAHSPFAHWLGHDHDHAHAPVNAGADVPFSAWTLGVSAGMVPCSGALIVLLVAIAMHRLAFGLCLVAAFSLGLGSVLVALGVIVIHTRDRLGRMRLSERWLRALPLLSSCCVLALGVAICWSALAR